MLIPPLLFITNLYNILIKTLIIRRQQYFREKSHPI